MEYQSENVSAKPLLDILSRALVTPPPKKKVNHVISVWLIIQDLIIDSSVNQFDSVLDIFSVVCDLLNTLLT